MMTNWFLFFKYNHDWKEMQEIDLAEDKKVSELEQQLRTQFKMPTKRGSYE